jgi:hypothetical protein
LYIATILFNIKSELEASFSLTYLLISFVFINKLLSSYLFLPRIF